MCRPFFTVMFLMALLVADRAAASSWRRIMPQEGAGERPAGFWLDRAAEEAEAIDDPAVRAELFGQIATLQARLGDVAAWRKAMGQAEAAIAPAQVGPSPSPVQEARRRSAPSILLAMAREGNVAEARALAEDLAAGQEASRAGYHSYLAAGQAEGGDVEGAIATANELNDYQRRRALQSIVEALARSGQFERAREVVEMIPADAMERRDALRALARARARAGDYEAALAIAEQFQYEHDRESVYIYIVEAQAEAGDYAAARATASTVPLRPEWKSPAATSPEHGRALAYTTIAHVQLKRADIAGAKTTAAMFECQLKANLLRDIALAEIEAGDLEAARATVESIGGRLDPMDLGIASPRAIAAAALVRALAQRGRFDDAAQTAGAMSARPDLLLEIAETALAAGDREQAAEMARAVAEDRGEFSWLGQPLDLRLARLQRDLGEPEPYERLVASLHEQAERAPDEDQRHEARAMLFGIAFSDGAYERAAELIEGVPHASWLLGFAINAAAQAGDYEGARALAEAMPTPADREAALQAILADYVAAAPAEERLQRIRQLDNPRERALALVAQAELAWQRDSL